MTKYFEEIEDTRQQGKIKYILVEVIVITIAAVTAGAEHWNEIAMYCKSKVDMFRREFNLKLENGVPKAAEIHAYSKTQVSSLPMTDSVVKIITETAKMLNSTLEALGTLRNEMDKLSSQLSEYETVMNLYGVGKVFCSQLIAEIGDVRRIEHSKSVAALAGIDPPPNQSGKVDTKSRSISKRGSPTLRKTIFQIMQIYLKKQPADEPVYQFLDKKRSEGKPYKVYMIAAAHKFLRIYYARVMQALS